MLDGPIADQNPREGENLPRCPFQLSSLLSSYVILTASDTKQSKFRMLPLTTSFTSFLFHSSPSSCSYCNNPKSTGPVIVRRERERRRFGRERESVWIFLCLSLLFPFLLLDPLNILFHGYLQSISRLIGFGILQVLHQRSDP